MNGPITQKIFNGAFLRNPLHGAALFGMKQSSNDDKIADGIGGQIDGCAEETII
jgi:hypothetical protein